MKDAILSSAFEVTSPRVATVFSDPLRRRLTLLLAAQPRSLAELAQDTGHNLKKLHYHITVLQDLGLVVVKWQRARAGRAIKLYGAIAPAFLVPTKLSMKAPEVALMAELRESLAEERDRLQGMLYYLDANGHPRMRQVRPESPRRPAAFELWKVLKLSPKDFAKLNTALEECLGSLRKDPSPDGHTYLLHFAVARRTKQRV